jgi:hypothetical protein
VACALLNVGRPNTAIRRQDCQELYQPHRIDRVGKAHAGVGRHRRLDAKVVPHPAQAV